MKAPTGKLALAYRSLAVAEERAERFMAERDALQALLNERDGQIDQLGQVLGEILVAAGMIRGDVPLSGPQLLQFGRQFCENLPGPLDERALFENWLRSRPHVLNVGFNKESARYVLQEDEDCWQAWQARAALK
jgi:hypothetical protein